MNLDVKRIKQDFPVLKREINGKALVYLDSANTSQKPNSVISAMGDYYNNFNANVHRGSYQLANEATAILEGARDKVTDFINANNRQEIIFAKNATEAINLVSNTWGRANLTKGDVIVLTELEHHANIVPWHILAKEKEIEIRWIKVTDDGYLDLSNFDALIDGAKLLSFAAMSNVLGTFTPAACANTGTSFPIKSLFVAAWPQPAPCPSGNTNAACVSASSCDSLSLTAACFSSANMNASATLSSTKTSFSPMQSRLLS